MFAGLIARAARLAEARARARRRALAARLAQAVRAEATDEGVLISGRGLRRRLARDPGLRRALAERGR
jgi:hypothetical protein